MLWLDRLAAGILAPLAMWVLASGLDDLFLDLYSLYSRLLGRPARKECAPPASEKRIALLIPTWHEDAVIRHMLEHNVAAVQYTNYEIFVGVYPNDIPTLTRAVECERRMPRVHHVLCPHDGPTSKADCLNWLYYGVLLHEEQSGRRFDVLVHHDAEDMIHPRSLGWISQYTHYYDMVQVPVLPLPTPWWDFTHGTYCDDFAESHLKELHLRQRLGGFLPSCGVGTAYRRSALDRLSWNQHGQPFRPDSLTEDYHTGLYLHRLGCSQVLLDARELGEGPQPGATREYFPRTFADAVKQRSRWVTGIALQSWQQIGWDAGPGQLYWLWRDRKGLIGNPLTMLANAIFLYGLVTWLAARASGGPWHLGEQITAIPWLAPLLALNTVFIVVRQGSRALCARTVYGTKHALLSPVRTAWGNFINFCAVIRALWFFAGARLRGRRVEWLKTDHRYPSHQGLTMHKRRLGEVLLEMKLAPPEEIEEALGSLEPGERLGERLIRRGAVSEPDLYRALASQQSLPFEPVDAKVLTERALQRLPLRFARRLGVVPVRIAQERYLCVASAELPSDAVTAGVARLSGLEPRFQLITPSNYRTLEEALEMVAAHQAGGRPARRL